MQRASSISKFGAALAVLTLVACAPMKPEKVSQRTRVPGVEAKNAVFAQLANQDKQWYFAQLSAQPPQDVPSIQLGPMRPINPPDRKDAVRGLLGLLPTQQRHSLTYIHDPMSQFSVDPLNMLEMYTLGLVIVIPGTVFGPLIALATANPRDLGWVLPLYGSSQPRESKYEHAVRQAISVDHLSTDWGTLQTRYDDYLNGQQEMSRRLVEERQHLQDELQRIDTERKQRLTQALPDAVRMAFDNQSGWPAPDNQNLRQWVKVAEVRPLTHPGVTLDISWPKVLPAKNIGDFRQHLDEAETKLAQAPAQLSGQIQLAEDAIKTYAQQASTDDGYLRIDSDSLATALRGWQYFEPTLPGEGLQMEGGKVQNIDCYCITLRARQFFNVIPPAFHVADSHLSVDWDGQNLTVYNQGTSHVVIDSVTVQFNDDISKQEDENLTDNREIGPGELRRFRGLGAHFQGGNYILSREQARQISIPFGVAVHYHDQATQTTLQLQRKADLNLESILEQL